MPERITGWKDAPVWNPSSIDRVTATLFHYLGDAKL